jgi:hypothetical protein
LTVATSEGPDGVDDISQAAAVKSEDMATDRAPDFIGRNEARGPGATHLQNTERSICRYSEGRVKQQQQVKNKEQEQW